MDKESKLHLKPYSFRGNMMWVLYICTVLAGVISLLFAYVISHVNVQSELKLQEQAVAVYLLEMEQRTELPLNVMLRMVQMEDLQFTTMRPFDTDLPEGLKDLMGDVAVYTHQSDVSGTPVTYVALRGEIVRIEALHDGALVAVAFVRVIFSALSYLAVFLLLITFASFRLSKPVQMMTEATARVQEGDFDVRLPAHEVGEVGELMRSFNEMTEALSRTAYLQKDFISSVSHEFKTPIASIRGFAKMLQMPGLTEEQKAEYIDLIAKESERLSRLSETLLRLSALEQQTAPASLSSFSLDEQLRQVILRLEPTWSAKDIVWQLELDEEVNIVSDEALINHVWINLIQNAIKFTPEGGEIEARVFTWEGRAVVEIQDHGCGMEPQTVSRIFDRFFQADRSRKQEGVGLGLTLVKRILDIMGGDIKVRSALGEGSTFRVTLPLQPAKYHAFPEENPHA